MRATEKGDNQGASGTTHVSGRKRKGSDCTLHLTELLLFMTRAACPSTFQSGGLFSDSDDSMVSSKTEGPQYSEGLWYPRPRDRGLDPMAEIETAVQA